MKTIFVADDNIVNLVTADEALSKNYNIYTFASALTLLDLLKNIIPDLILLDIMMPVMDGFETLKILKADKQYAHIPVIFMTSKDDEKTKALGYKSGVVDFILKPFSQTDILRQITSHLPAERESMNNISG